MRLGIVGLPNAGKSTLFNALTRAGAETGNYPFTTLDRNVGTVAVPDERLPALAACVGSARVTPAVLEFVDIAGLVRGASRGEGLGNRFLAHIREVDAIVHVVRCHETADVAHVEGSVDPERDLEIVEAELLLADLATVERRQAEAARRAKSGARRDLDEVAALAVLADALARGRLARGVDHDQVPLALRRE
ncbi:MAG TPA: GTPase, partial [Bacillota bacterium]